MLGVNYAGLVAPLIEAVKELKMEITTQSSSSQELRQIVSEQQTEIDELKKTISQFSQESKHPASTPNIK